VFGLQVHCGEGQHPMFVVCHETAEQAKRTRAEKEGKMREQIEQLKAEIAALEAAKEAMQKFETKIAEIERQADDPFEEAKQLIRDWGRLVNNASILQQVALYVRHLELEVKQLESIAIPAEVFQRAALQRRIKHQRRELRMLNRGMHRQALEIRSYEHINSDLHRNKGYLMGEIVKHQEKIRGLESEIKGMKAMKS
jgi:vacuolar-type H+-ATPase subunit I/STV1